MANGILEALPPQLTKAQSDMRNFAKTRLERAADDDPSGAWINVDPETKANAESLLAELRKIPPPPMRGIVINVDPAMTWFKKTTFYEWDRGRYPKVVLPNPNP